jgi:hypothetical protein
VLRNAVPQDQQGQQTDLTEAPEKQLRRTPIIDRADVKRINADGDIEDLR